MADIALAKRRYQLMGQDPTYRFVALIGLQCCAAAETGVLVRFNSEDSSRWGYNWPDPTEKVPAEFGPTKY